MVQGGASLPAYTPTYTPVCLEEVKDGVEDAAELGVAQHRDARQDLVVVVMMLARRDA